MATEQQQQQQQKSISFQKVQMNLFSAGFDWTDIHICHQIRK